MDLEAEFGAIDIYLFDQILRGRISARDRVFDAGCGSGRNLVYLMRAGAEVYGVDSRQTTARREPRHRVAGGQLSRRADSAKQFAGRVCHRRHQQRRAALRA